MSTLKNLRSASVNANANVTLTITTKELEEIIEKAVTKHTEELKHTVADLKNEISELKEIVQSLVKQEVSVITANNTNKVQELLNESAASIDKVVSQPSKKHRQESDSTQKNNNKQRTKIVRGTDEITNVNKELSFSAAARRAWIYVGRVDVNTRGEQISKYLNYKFPGNNFQVEELPRREGATSVAFKVGADVSLMDELYKGHTWPAGVLIKKFVFFRKQRGQF